ncbi:MAG: magnesium transporter CorA, partial [Erysipelothrix sp.]|nr:magnesium transporter CorA [Erysipelothrix sp.]
IRREKPNSLWNEEQIFDYASIKIEINQLNQNIDMNQEILKSMIDVSESLYSNKLNKTMKSLTSITLIISIPMMITSFYGMNIQLPFQDHPYALIIVFLISFLLTLIPVMYFYKKDLF